MNDEFLLACATLHLDILVKVFQRANTILFIHHAGPVLGGSTKLLVTLLELGSLISRLALTNTNTDRYPR
jgi:hypothetical protein